MNEMIDSSTAAELMGISHRRVNQLCFAGRLAGAVFDGHKWRVPADADPRLARTAVDTEPAGPDEMAGLRAPKRDQAISRLGIIKEFGKFAAEIKQKGHNRRQAAGMFAARHGIGRRTLGRWIGRYRKEGLPGLVDRRGETRFVNELVSAGAIELFCSMYLDQRRPTLASCTNLVRFVNQSQSQEWKIPGDKFFYRYVERDIPKFVRVLHREGQAAYEAECSPYVQVDPDSVEPGEVWVGDHHQFNLWLRHRGRWVRPWVTAWMDYRSRLIVGWQISVAPNQTTILLAFKRAAQKYGPPDSVKIDNGKDYDSECWTGTTKLRRRAAKKGYIDEPLVAGIYALMGIGVSFSIKYHPQSKPVERLFDTIDGQFAKTFSTYCGKSVATRPDYIFDLLKNERAISQAHSLDEFAELFGQYAQVYNRSKHTGRGMDGRSPAEVMDTRSSRRALAEGVLDLVCRL